MSIFVRCIKNNIKATLSSPAVWITLFASSLFLFGRHTSEIGQTDMLNLLLNCAMCPLDDIVPLTIGVVAGIDILRERKNKCCDIQTVSGKHAFVRYTAKLITYVILAFVLSLIISFSVFFVIWYGYGRGVNFPDYTVTETLLLLLVRVIGYAIPVILQYVALTTTVCLIFKSSATGICCSVFYCFFTLVMPDQLFHTAFRYYFYSVPHNIYYFFACWHIKPDPINILPEYVTGPLTKPVILSYVLIFGVCLTLLVLDYFLYKNTKDA